MAPKTSLASYLFTRLRQLGVGAVHGVPGDYTLRALDHVAPTGLKWIGNCNELNAGYAADGYARVRGISALFTTYGVGELSAINAVAGSYAEYAPVVHIVGTPTRRHQKSRAMVHHSLGDGNMRVFAEMHAKVTAAQANLVDSETAPDLCDMTLRKCMKESRPVYIELPADMVSAQVLSSRLEEPLDVNPPDAGGEEDHAVELVLSKVNASKQPLILVDGVTATFNILDEINELVRITGFPTMSFTHGGGIIDGNLKNYYGTHTGKFGAIDNSPYASSTDLVLLFGPLLSDTNTIGWSTVPNKEVTVTLQRTSVEVGTSSHAIQVKSFMQKLLNYLKTGRSLFDASRSGLRSSRDLLKSLRPADPSAPIDQDTFWLRISSFFRSGDIILLANGTPVVGSRDFVLPPRTKVICSGLWLSVGHMLPAAQGAALAQQEISDGRTILFEGDGSFQATAQELSTIIRYRLNVTIFLINNDGYTFERLIHGFDKDYNDVARWRYLEAASLFGAPTDGSYKVETHRARTWGELLAVLANESFHDGQGLKMVEVIVARDDTQKNFKLALQLAGQQLAAEAK